jgi:hypothetical protein
MDGAVEYEADVVANILNEGYSMKRKEAIRRVTGALNEEAAVNLFDALRENDAGKTNVFEDLVAHVLQKELCDYNTGLRETLGLGTTDVYVDPTVVYVQSFERRLNRFKMACPSHPSISLIDANRASKCTLRL